MEVLIIALTNQRVRIVFSMSDEQIQCRLTCSEWEATGFGATPHAALVAAVRNRTTEFEHQRAQLASFQELAGK